MTDINNDELVRLTERVKALVDRIDGRVPEQCATHNEQIKGVCASLNRLWGITLGLVMVMFGLVVKALATMGGKP
jgi:phage shock protein PspC (stress-responsive transcriptional regulator)